MVTSARARKFRQAAFVYLHVAILYEAAAYVMWREELLPARFGPPWLWLLSPWSSLVFPVIIC